MNDVLFFFPACDRITYDPEITPEGRRLLSVRPCILAVDTTQARSDPTNKLKELPAALCELAGCRVAGARHYANDEDICMALC